MKCPHCLVEFHEGGSIKRICEDSEGMWSIIYDICPRCKRVIIWLFLHDKKSDSIIKQIMVWPKNTSRPVPPEVPKEFSEDFIEACLVLPESPKASAALSRRCLQHLLREKAGVKHGNLSDEIQQVLDSKSLPSYLAKSIDDVRIIGNFAAHPIKSESTGEIVDVEPGEANWNLDVLEGLFDFYFVQPAKMAVMKAALEKKLKDAGKPPTK